MRSPHDASQSTGHDSAGSHSVRRHTRNKKSDPFLELSNDIDVNADQPFPRSPKGENDEDVDSLFADLVLAPLNMVTFIISLFLVDRQQRQWRLSQRASNNASHWSYFHPDPYQSSGSSAWSHKNNDNSAARPALKHSGSFQGWYARKKKGAIAKLEIGDAFEMRKRVLVALLAWTAFGVWASYYAMRRMYNWIAA